MAIIGLDAAGATIAAAAGARARVSVDALQVFGGRNIAPVISEVLFFRKVRRLR
jgi:hypothetical protein